MMYRLVSLCALAALTTGCANALLPTNVTPEVPLTVSVEQADSKLEQVRRERAQAEAQYAATEQTCLARFLVNDCLDQAKEERRIKLAVLNAVENEAQYFKRKANVEERDRKLAESEKEFAAEEARRAAEPAAPPKVVQPLPPSRGRLAGKAAAHDARAAKKQAQESAKAAEAPAKVAAFQRKQVEAAERQQKVAARQAERARKQAEKEAQDKANAAKAEAAKAAKAKGAAKGS